MKLSCLLFSVLALVSVFSSDAKPSASLVTFKVALMIAVTPFQGVDADAKKRSKTVKSAPMHNSKHTDNEAIGNMIGFTLAVVCACVFVMS
jgi:hypothetical protein